MTSLPEYYRGNVTWVGSLDRRLSTMARLVAEGAPARVLDVGCGAGVLLEAVSFDVVVAGEVIEHVPHPDLLLAELRRVLAPHGRLVLSTPNIVGWANRVLVPLGIQPLFTETSSEVHLGRRWRALGQGNQVQGHLKVFSHRALLEILHRSGFAVRQVLGMPGEFPSPVDRVDRMFARFPSLASDLLVVALRVEALPPTEPPRRKDGLPVDPGTASHPA